MINLSLGHDPAESCQTDPLCAAVRGAVKAGIVVVCAAGNKGKNSAGQIIYGGIACPGNEPAALTVGALNTHNTADRADDTVATYSSRGPTAIDQLCKPDLLAPVNKIVSVRAPGLVEVPVKTQFGWHVIIVTAIQPATRLTLDSARAQLRQELAVRKHKRAVDALLAKLRDRTQVHFSESAQQALATLEL